MTATPAQADQAEASLATHATRFAWVLPAHILAVVLIQSTASAVMFVMPYLARKHFDGNVWQVMLITAAPNVLYILSIFWQHLSHRFSRSTYFLIYWAVAFLPWGLAGFSLSYWHLAALHIIASAGGAAWSPISGDLLRRLYADDRRGAAYSYLNGAQLLFGACAAVGLGVLLSSRPDAFRLVLPGVAVLQLMGVLLLVVIDRATASHLPARVRPERVGEGEGLFAAMIEPVLHMNQILREDRVFLRYEAAFMTYGVGWMICAALLPQIGDSLHLNYLGYLQSTQAPLYIAMVLITIPFGRINDRFGPARTSALAFGLYAFFPLSLIFVRGADDLTASCMLWGICFAGVNFGWMLGPVSLAPTPAKAAQYVSIHATMVGLRGAAFQFVGVALFELTGSFTVSLLIAAAGFAWAAVQMWRLKDDFGRARRA